MNTMLRIASFFVLFVALGALIFNFVHPPVKAQDDETPIAEDDVDGLIEDYHENANRVFNGYIKVLVKFGKTGKEEDLVKLTEFLTPPSIGVDQDGAPTKRATCTSSNLSTYCLAMEMMRRYFIFREQMINARKVLHERAAQRFESLSQSGQAPLGAVIEQPKPLFSGRDVEQGSRTLQEYGEMIHRIDRELVTSRTALDQALATYNELHMALPLHIKYKKVIDALTEYRSELSDIRKEVILYPATFIDVTTPACT